MWRAGTAMKIVFEPARSGVHKGDDLTMTVGELRELLATFPEELPMLATWEGQLCAFQPSNFSVRAWKGASFLEINVESHI